MYKEISFKNLPNYSNAGIELLIEQEATYGLGCILDYYNEINNTFVSFDVAIDFDKYKTYSKEDVLEYIKFISNSGFPIQVQDDDVLTLSLDRKEYKTYNHVLAGYTMIRLLFYSWEENAAKIPEAAISIYNELEGKVSEIECLQMAHYKVLNGRIDYTHFLMSGYKSISKLKDIKTKLLNGQSVNDSFNGDRTVSFEEIKIALSKGIPELLKVLS